MAVAEDEEEDLPEPDEFPLEELQLEEHPEPIVELEPDELPVLPEEPAVSLQDEPLLSLSEAVARIPAELRQQMEQLLRADFREVQRWKGE